MSRLTCRKVGRFLFFYKVPFSGTGTRRAREARRKPIKTGKPLIVLLLTVILGLTLRGMARAETAKDYLYRGIEAGKQGQYDQAITDFTKALDLEPRYAEAYYNRARIFYEKKEYSQAWEDVRKAQSLGVKIDPNLLDILRRASGREK